ncbi:MAG: hypothetical protein AB7O26_13905 [Planctomycetaceae bacterium]
MKFWLILAKKEWQEHRWNVLALTVILIGAFLTIRVDPDYSRDFKFYVEILLLGYGLFAPTFIAMSVCSAEYSSRSVGFVRSLPIARWKVALIRIVSGLVALIVPPILMGAVASLTLLENWIHNESLRDSFVGDLTAVELVQYIAVALACYANVYAWIVAFAANLRWEFRACMAGLLITVGLLAAGIYGEVGPGGTPKFPDVSAVRLMSVVIGPIFVPNGSVIVRYDWNLFVVTAVGHLLLVAGLLAIAVRQYGREENWIASLVKWAPIPEFRLRRQHEPRAALGPPLASPERALVWLQLRQSIPVCIVAVLMLIGVSFVVEHKDRWDVFGIYPFIGCLLALVIGVGSYVHELDPKLYTFWRSRPISPSNWFWLKFMAGLFALLIVYDLPIFLLLRNQSRPGAGYSGYASWFPLMLHFVTFTFAVLAACSIRHVVYSMLLAALATSMLFLVPWVYSSVPDFYAFWSLATRPNVLGLESLVKGVALSMPVGIAAAIVSAFLIQRDVALYR